MSSFLQHKLPNYQKTNALCSYVAANDSLTPFLWATS